MKKVGESMSSNFGHELKKLRTSKKLSLKQVAKKGGISHSYISQIENNNRNAPKPEMIKKLAKGLDEDYFDLMVMAGYFDQKDAQFRKSVYEESIKNKKELDEVIHKTEKELKKMEKDLYYLLTDYPNEVYYQQEILSKEEKEKILAMLKILFKWR